MKKVLIVAIIALSIFGLSYSVYSQNTAQNAPESVTQEIKLDADTIFTLVNAERTKAGLKPLVRNAKLDNSALEKAVDMDQNNYFDHVNPRTGVRGYTLIPNGMCSYKSENIGLTYGYDDNNTKQLEWWMNSPPHRQAILNAKYALTGVAVSGDKVVQHFCISK